MEQLEFITSIVKILNAFDKELIGDADMTPYLGKIPVLMQEMDQPIGWLVDEIGGVWSFHPNGGIS